MTGPRPRRLADLAGRHAVMVAVSLAFALPLVRMVVASLMTEAQVNAFPPRWIPDPPRPENYAEFARILPFWRFMGNSALVTGLNVVGVLLSSPLVAYAFARLRWPGRDLLFAALIGTMLLPPQVTVVPIFIALSRLGLVDSYFYLVAPAFLGTPFYVFLLRQFFYTIPREFDEAARIDGASYWQTYWYVLLPQLRPALTTVAILHTLAIWNDYFNPLLVLRSTEMYTLPLGLTLYRQGVVDEYHLLMAASLVTTLPILLLFFALQRYFVRGVTFSGIRG